MTYTSSPRFAIEGETTNASSIFVAEPAVAYPDVYRGCGILWFDDGPKSAAEFSRGDQRSAVRDRVLLQGEMGTCGGVSGALQEESLPSAEERDGARAHAEGEHGDAAVSHDRRRPLGLSRDHRIQERGHGQRQFRELRHHQAAISG